MQADSLLERRYRVLGRHSPLFYDKPLHLVRGEGVWLYDADGKRYLDAYNNVPHVGHCHPRVVAALSRQAATLNTHTRYLDENVVAYAERLTSLFDPTALDGDVLLHRQRSERAGAAHRARLQRRHGDHSHGLGVSRQHGGRDAGELAVHAAGQARAVRAHGAGDGSLPGPRGPQRRATRNAPMRTTSSARSMHSPPPESASPGLLFCTAFSSEGSAHGARRIHGEGARARARRRRLLHRRRSAGGFRPARQPHVGTSKARRDSRTSSRSASPWAMAIRSPASSRAPTSSTRSPDRNMYFNTFGGNPGLRRRRHGRPRCARGRAPARECRCTWATTRSRGWQELARAACAHRRCARRRAVLRGRARQRSRHQDSGDGANQTARQSACASAACSSAASACTTIFSRSGRRCRSRGSMRICSSTRSTRPWHHCECPPQALTTSGLANRRPSSTRCRRSRTSPCAAGISPSTNLAPIKVRENAVFRIDLAGGGRAVLRVHRVRLSLGRRARIRSSPGCARSRRRALRCRA